MRYPSTIVALFFVVPAFACSASLDPGETAPIHPTTLSDKLRLQDARRISEGVLSNFDKNIDGKLAPVEYAHASLGVFESLDKNHDSELSKEETLGYLSEEDIRKADTNRDSRISLAEALQCFVDLFHEKDLNKDGFLTIEEVEVSIKKKQQIAKSARPR